MIDKIVQLVMDVQNQENTTIPLLEKQLREVNKKLDNLMKAIEDGLYTRTTKGRLEALEIQKDELASFGFDHNFDHNAKDFIWSIAGKAGSF